MKFFWIGFCVTAALTAGCGPTPISRDQQEANAERFDLAEADRLLAQQAEPAPQEVTVSAPPAAANELVVNEEVRLLSEPAATVAEPEPAPDIPTDEAIQKALKNLGLYDGAIDGKIGPKTEAAIKKFQEEHNLQVDGKVGPKTWEELKKAF
jgi:murein L,D-transpeptidase YcbB/YkuD